LNLEVKAAVLAKSNKEFVEVMGYGAHFLWIQLLGRSAINKKPRKLAGAWVNIYF